MLYHCGMESYEEMKKLILSIEKDVGRIFNGNQFQASKRVRKKMQLLRKMAKDFRQEIQDYRAQRIQDDMDNFQL